ncbi:MAG: hypothetical protein FWE04_00945 [Oscillospiraceae bacterium]|nr:hypothetical protein [Oscillospiraceae bacterium]
MKDYRKILDDITSGLYSVGEIDCEYGFMRDMTADKIKEVFKNQDLRYDQKIACEIIVGYLRLQMSFKADEGTLTQSFSISTKYRYGGEWVKVNLPIKGNVNIAALDIEVEMFKVLDGFANDYNLFYHRPTPSYKLKKAIKNARNTSKSPIKKGGAR